MSLPLTKACKGKVAKYTAQGKSVAETAELAGIATRSVSNIKASPEYKVKIEQYQADYLDKDMDGIIRAERKLMDTGQKFIEGATPKEYQDAPVLMGLYHGLTKGIKGSLGILPSPTVTNFIQNLYQDNRSQTIAPGVLALISGGLTDPGDTEAIDTDYEIIE